MSYSESEPKLWEEIFIWMMIIAAIIILIGLISIFALIIFLLF